jgi:hypothetical protein
MLNFVVDFVIKLTENDTATKTGLPFKGKPVPLTGSYLQQLPE